MLTITKLRGAEYLIRAVADGLEDYYMGSGEAPGVWRGAWAADLGLIGVVEADALRALVNGVDPGSGVELLAGHRDRKVRAIDVTLSPPKSVSLLWAFGTPETSAAVSIAVVEATDLALGFLEERAAVARRQEGGIRRRVGTGGFAIATFAHRASRDGDPQLHTHCLIPNVVCRDDGVFVAFDANPLHLWAKATGTVFQNELQRLLTQRLGVAWAPERNGTREMLGFSRGQLRAFSKRTEAIESRLEARGELAFESKRARMRADDRASVRTRPRKDPTLTPERLRDRWATQAAAVGLERGVAVDQIVLGRHAAQSRALAEGEIFAALVDPATGLCAIDSRFGEAHVVERVAALSAGQLDLGEVLALSGRFLASDRVVRLVPDLQRRRPPEWSTVELRVVEDRLLDHLHRLVNRQADPANLDVVEAAIAGHPGIGADQIRAVRTLCGNGPAVRTLVAPAGFGKTRTLAAAADAETRAGRAVLAVAPTHRAVAELRACGLDAATIARVRRTLANRPLTPGAVVIVDESSLVATRDAAAILAAVTGTAGARVWFAGDPGQGQSVGAGGLAAELQRLAAYGRIPTAGLRVNRRQLDPAEREALARFRAGDVEASQAIRADHGWERELATPTEIRQGLAAAAVTDADRHGAEQVAVLAVSHADCEDLADRIRAIRVARGELRGPTLTGPGWGSTRRVYAAGDRVLIHANLDPGHRVFNGAIGTVVAVTATGIELSVEGGGDTILPAAVVAGHRADGTPNVSHAWARTVDGAQGGTWGQVHLLGTAALSRFTGYVGQSRGRHPTHTWNTRPETDHPARLLADQRTPTEVVLDAMGRAEPKTLAADDDPWTIDRRLRAELDEHLAVAARRPPDRSRDVDAARQRLGLAHDEQGGASTGVDHHRAERDRLGPLTRLRRGGRADIARADQALAGARRRLDRATHELDSAAAAVADLEGAVTDRSRWDQAHGWRVDRITEIDDTLAHHWAQAVLRAVRADDPLAFGRDRVRQAHGLYTHDLHELRAGESATGGTPDDWSGGRDQMAHHRRRLAKAIADLGAALDTLDTDLPRAGPVGRHLGGGIGGGSPEWTRLPDLEIASPGRDRPETKGIDRGLEW
ncbi:MAG: MobF family relaxase [Acidimicrobiales bacterium]